jgi:hypothetical protein
VDLIKNPEWSAAPVLGVAKLLHVNVLEKEISKMAVAIRRIVKVYVADTNENIPLDKTILHRGDEALTDLTDQELFFEIDIKSILDEHNKYRVTVINKAVKDRTEYLEPAKVRDLRMTVVTVAQF